MKLIREHGSETILRKVRSHYIPANTFFVSPIVLAGAASPVSSVQFLRTSFHAPIHSLMLTCFRTHVADGHAIA
ncbi:MAG: hypothetical protein ABGZ35_21685 [Planctomycetaceae bacterium]